MNKDKYIEREQKKGLNSSFNFLGKKKKNPRGKKRDGNGTIPNTKRKLTGQVVEKEINIPRNKRIN